MTLIKKISNSQIETFWDCPQCWARNYLLGLRDPATIPLAVGSAVHLGPELGFAAKTRGVPVNEAEIRARALQSLLGEMPKAAPADQRLVQDGAVTLWRAVKQYDPLLVEPSWRVEVARGWLLAIRPDLVTTDLDIIDYKTEAARPHPKYRWTLDKASRSLQAPIYGIGLQAAFGISEYEHTYLVLRKSAPPEVLEPLTIKIDAASIQMAEAIVNKVTADIEAAIEARSFPRGACRFKRCDTFHTPDMLEKINALI